ncbi:hypothetical protein QQS21_003789 [Conoideocrella luteorostrata]|uniref:Helix-turn-helix-domain containing protein type n=1 Tax=Conoideocrella luteorostrata TaxID=1105319 RepID=A0AAJ0CSS3_9HYPO|nr:hypothetical protein QQS21_003789 [Conoideocrella luteorostrata]
MAVYSLYDATITPSRAALVSLKNFLIIAERQSNSSTFLSSKLYEDMRPLTFQVHYATAQADKMAAKLSGREPMPFEENFRSLTDMYSRIDQVIETLDNADKNTVNRMGETLAPTPVGHDKVEDLPGKILATAAIMPNIFFHVSMTYAILRKEGVPLGKKDYMHSFVGKYMK